MAVSEAQKKANLKWGSKNLTTLGCRVRKDYADQVRQKAKEKNTSVNAIFLKALEEFMKEEN